MYRSPYEAYPFLADAPDDLRCDFELLTDKLASGAGLLRARIQDDFLRQELLWVCELIYHMNPALRTSLRVTAAEKKRLLDASMRLEGSCADRSLFVVPQGCEAGCMAHILRVQSKELVRLLYRYLYQGNQAQDELIDLANILSGYFFHLALHLNAVSGIEEKAFVSRNYR